MEGSSLPLCHLMPLCVQVTNWQWNGNDTKTIPFVVTVDPEEKKSSFLYSVNWGQHVLSRLLAGLSVAFADMHGTRLFEVRTYTLHAHCKKKSRFLQIIWKCSEKSFVNK